ncbi:NUDIX domain-containing protein [Salipaludibacillus sp. CUR1]|uniref:NUDIX hydrolase n=1 Tax=Salipaludibacillus sp. CUR1 TaxID=2820003 RepID=UPI001E31D1D2|nr:NUDIX domain-containing protein [Salipaludibacillus sp. CUR1]
MPVKKAYGYVTRVKDGRVQVLVFQHPVPEAGVQIPKGTVETEEAPDEGVIREMKEETGLNDVHLNHLLAEDLWKNNDGAVHHRYFYKLTVSDAPDEWVWNPAGGGEEEGLTFRFFWISAAEERGLIRGHGDYLHLIFSH